MSQADKQSTLPVCGVAVDMGASHLRFVLATNDGEILDESREHLRAESGPGGVIAQVRDGIRSLVDRVDPGTGKVIDANNVPGWREVNMGSELEQSFGVPVYLDNDANMAAIGEHWRGAARDVDNFVFVALGTGIGAGIYVNGQICRGRSGFAGELFRMNLEWPRWQEDFPDTGYLEVHVSGVALATEGRKILSSGNGSAASTLTERRDARYVFDAMHDGDPQARELVEKSFVVLGVAVANVVSIVDPERIVFNGGIVQGAPELLLSTVEEVVRKIHPNPPQIELSKLGDRAQIWGALRTLLEPAQEHAIRATSSRKA
jgi:glucokinase